MQGHTRSRLASVRARPWVWGLLLVALLIGLGLVGDPIGARAVTVDPVGQLASIAIPTVPVTVVVGGLFALVPGRQVVLRTALLLLVALYVAGITAPFVYHATGEVCGTGGPRICATTAPSRVIGVGGVTAAWALGLGAEEAVRAVRRSRSRA